MKYPKESGPQSMTEMYALLFGLLTGAYNMLAQYEKEDEQRSQQDMVDFMMQKNTEEKKNA